MEVVLLFEILIPSFRIQLDKELNVNKQREALLAQLDLFDDKRLAAVEHVRSYQNCIEVLWAKEIHERWTRTLKNHMQNAPSR